MSKIKYFLFFILLFQTCNAEIIYDNGIHPKQRGFAKHIHTYGKVKTFDRVIQLTKSITWSKSQYEYYNDSVTKYNNISKRYYYLMHDKYYVCNLGYIPRLQYCGKKIKLLEDDKFGYHTWLEREQADKLIQELLGVINGCKFLKNNGKNYSEHLPKIKVLLRYIRQLKLAIETENWYEYEHYNYYDYYSTNYNELGDLIKFFEKYYEQNFTRKIDLK